LSRFLVRKRSSPIQSSITTGKNPPADLITDIDGKTYNFVFIHGQRWKTTNLAVSHYRNGDRIPQVKRTKDWRALTTGAWCWYNNDSATGAVYGKLYNWYAVNDPRGLAPTGWHVPSDAEWDTLITHLGGYYAFAGGRLKDTGTIEAGTGLWYAPNTVQQMKVGSQGFRAAAAIRWYIQRSWQRRLLVEFYAVPSRRLGTGLKLPQWRIHQRYSPRSEGPICSLH
jgi:uncharacterized protein (TIGR02145 family)